MNNTLVFNLNLSSYILFLHLFYIRWNRQAFKLLMSFTIPKADSSNYVHAHRLSESASDCADHSIVYESSYYVTDGVSLLL